MSAPRHGLDREGLRGRLILMLAAVVIASVAAAGFAAISAFDRAVAPELANRTRLIGSIVRAEIQRALELGIPIGSVAGLDRYLAGTMEKFDEVDSITVTTSDGTAVAAVNRPPASSAVGRTRLGEAIFVRRAKFELPIIERNELVGGITVEISPLFIQTRLNDVFLDVMVLALIAILVAVELALAVTVTTVGKPLDRVFRLLGEQRDGNFLHRIRQGGLSGLGRTAARLNDHAEDLAARLAALPAGLRAALKANIGASIPEGRPARLRLSDLNDIRLALFLFSVATEIAAAFLPVYARVAPRPDWVDPDMAAAAPLVFYLVGAALMAPFAGALVQRFGARRLFLLSVPPTVLSIAAMGFAGSLAEIVFWRLVTVVFYTTATIACLGYAVRAAGPAGSARPFGAFIAVVYGGVFCGAALGGLLAGRFGYEAAFVIGAAIAVLSGALGASSMRGRVGDRATAAPDAKPAPAAGWLSGRFLALLLGIAVPMNAATAIVIWYLTPLMLSAAGSSPADIGRVVMLYYLSALLFTPAVTRLSDGRVGPAALVVTGALGAGAALLSLSLWSGFWAIASAVAGLGLGHTLIRTPLYALALRITRGSGRGLAALRFLERVGAMAGLAASAVLLGEIGPDAGLRMLGLAVLAGGAAYAIVEIAGRARRS